MPFQSKITQTLASIKRRAKAIVKAEKIQHSTALNNASIEAGYQNFRHAQNSLGLTPPTFKVVLTAFWGDRIEKKSGKETLTITLSIPWHKLIRKEQLDHCRGLANFRLGDKSYELEHWGCKSDIAARGRVYEAARTLIFMEATGLRPSSGYWRAFPKICQLHGTGIPNQDHVSVWYHPETRRYLIANEPYDQSVADKINLQEQWCEEHDYHMIKPLWAGMYYPDGGSRLYLFSHKKKGIPLQQLAERLNTLSNSMKAENWIHTSECHSYANQIRVITA